MDGKTRAVRFTSRWLLLVAGGAIAGLLFYFIPSFIRPDYFRDRDDGYITLSHAKNLAEYGFIGTSPSGQRVEGFSSPLHFWVYFLAFRAGLHDPQVFNTACALLCAIMMGIVLAWFTRQRTLPAVLLVAGCAAFLSTRFMMLEWHWSGMENPLFHLLWLSSLTGMAVSLHRARFSWWLPLVCFLCAISRAEMIFHLLPLLALYAWLGKRRSNSLQPFYHLLIVLVLWMAYSGWAWFYFGSFFPHTAAAQQIKLFSGFSNTASMLRSLKTSVVIFLDHGSAWILIIAVILFARNGLKQQFSFYASLLLLVTGLAVPWVFGEIRMGASRITSFLPLLPIFLLADNWDQVKKLQLPPPGRRVVALFLLLAGLGPILFSTIRGWNHPRWIGYEGEYTPAILAAAEKYSATNHIPMPMVAAPDLGKLSFAKTVNVLDMCWLGSPEWSAMRHDTASMKEYFFRCIRPDVVELHDVWEWHYQFLLQDTAWNAHYILYSAVNGSSIWVRGDWASAEGIAEKNLVNGLMQDCSPLWVEKAMTECSNEGPTGSCRYVMRSVYRMLPEIRKRGGEEAFIHLFEDDRFTAYDRALLMSSADKNWAVRIVESIEGRQQP